MVQEQNILSPLEELEKKFPRGHSVRRGEMYGVVSGYEIRSNGELKVILTMEDGSDLKIKVSVN